MTEDNFASAAIVFCSPGHPPHERCEIGDDCMECGVRDCPYAEPLHYDKDGCPACSCYPEYYE